jgi:hypothetical protein
VPEILQGYVELTYDLNHRATARFIEPLLYRSPHYRESSQSMVVRRICKTTAARTSTARRGSTPRTRFHIRRPFRDPAIDALFAMRIAPGSPHEPPRRSASRRATPSCSRRSSPTSGRRRAASGAEARAQRYDGEGVRIRYFGHACVLIESRQVSILTDPVVSYDFATDLPRYNPLRICPTRSITS